MPKEANRFRLGLFFSFAFILFIAVMIWMTGWFNGTSGNLYVCYFNESVQGLNSGSDVRYRGVPVGSIKNIGVAPDGRLVEVIMELDGDFHIASDIAARVDFMGITGLSIINLRVVESGESWIPEFTFDPPVDVIPVVQSQLEMIDKGLRRMTEVISEVDFRAISERTIQLLDNFNSLMDSERFDETLENINNLVADIDTLVIVYTNLGRRLDYLAENTDEDIDEFLEIVHLIAEQLTDLAGRLNSLSGNTDNILYQLETVLSETRMLLMDIGDHPEEYILVSPREDIWP